MLKFKGREIIYSFKYGGFVKKSEIIILYVISGSLFALSAILFIGLICLNNNSIWDNNIIASFIFVLVTACGLVTCCIFFLILKIKRNKVEKEMIKWLSDELLVERTVYPWIFSETAGGPKTKAKLFRFGIKFSVNDKKYSKISNKYDGFVRQFKEKPMVILYSPKYDQVMVIKN